jgi:hypothetical protein
MVEGLGERHLWGGLGERRHPLPCLTLQGIRHVLLGLWYRFPLGHLFLVEWERGDFERNLDILFPLPDMTSDSVGVEK